MAPFVESVKSQEAQVMKSFGSKQKQANRATALPFNTSSPGTDLQKVGQKGTSSTLDILSSLFPTAPAKIDQNDPFADAV